MAHFLPGRGFLAGLVEAGPPAFQKGLERFLGEGEKERAAEKKFESQLRLLEAKEKQKQDRIDKLLQKYGKKPTTSQKEPSEEIIGEEIVEGPEDLSDEEIFALSLEEPQAASLLQRQQEAKAKEKRDIQKEESKKQAALRAETLPIRKEYADKGRAAEQGIRNKTELMRLIDAGNLNDPTFSAVAQALPLRLGERLLSPDTVAYRAGMIDEFRDLRSIFQGQTRMKEIDLLEDKIAGIYLTDEQKKAILKSRMDALQADLIKAEVAAELEAKGEFGGLLEFQNKVEKEAKPRLEALFHKILDEQKAIIQDAENLKKIPLNAKDPEHVEIMKQFFQEAKGDKEKAKKLAKEKGYTWKGM